jgi:DNA polymerase II large subunit
MARKKATETVEIEDQVEDIDDVDDPEDLEEIDEFETDSDELAVLEEGSSDGAGEDDSDDLDDGADESDAAALDELEAAELSMLTPDEAAEVIRVDEAAEVASLRRAELALDKEADSVTTGEFVCSTCFLVKKNTQLANKRKQICNDCAA